MRFNHPAAAAAFKAVARTFGEGVRIVPLMASEYTVAEPDALRAPANTRATIALTPAVQPMDGARGGSQIGTSTRIAGQRATAWFPPDVYAGIGYELRHGDRIIFTERPGRPAYTVSREPVRSDRGDVTVYLVQEGCE